MSESAKTPSAREPEVGEILLFCIDDQEGRKKWRPLFVCSVVDGDTVSGEVFPDWERDSKSRWALRLFTGLRKDNRHQWVSGVLPGEEVGSWKFKPFTLDQVRPLREVKEYKEPKKIVPLSQVKGSGR